MSKPFTATLAIAGLALVPAFSFLPQSMQDPAPLDLDGLKALIANMGYEKKDLSETKFEISITQDTFDVPVAFEVSGSGRYIWLTAFLGKVPDEGLPALQANALLRRNHSIQPAHFYVTSTSSLMIGLAVENRGMDAVMMRRAVSKLAADVASSSDDWAIQGDEEEEEDL